MASEGLYRGVDSENDVGEVPQLEQSSERSGKDRGMIEDEPIHLGRASVIGNLASVGQRLTDDQVERLVTRACDLARGMNHRTGRLPDYADFRAAFKDELSK